jgi:phospholipase/carboxylesterase
LITQVIMNRIQPRKPLSKPHVHNQAPSGEPKPSIVEQGVVTRCEEDSPSATFAPLHYERNYAYPLIVWLHGGGESECQLKRIMPAVSMRNYVAVAPRGTVPLENASAAFDWVQSAEPVQAAEQRVLDCIRSVRRRFHLATERVFLAGHGSGGTMALRIALRQPRLFAGVLTLEGQFPTGFAPLANLTEARQLPIFLVCNRAAVRYPSAAVCEDLRLIHSAGMTIMLREYPGSDGLSPQMLADMDRWLMEQITGAGVSSKPASAASQADPR